MARKWCATSYSQRAWILASEFDLGWAVGLFEGEGTISIRDAGRGVLDLQLSSTDEDVVRHFAAVVGVGRVGGPYGPYQANQQVFWKWYVHGACAAQTLRAFLPYLGVRRSARAAEGLARFEARQVEPHYTVSRKGMGGRPTHKGVTSNVSD